MNGDAATATVLPGAGRNQSLERAFGLLGCLAAHPTGASIAELTREIDLPRATVTRLLASLADAGAVTRVHQSREWVMGPTILRLSHAVTSLAALRERARPLMEDLAATLQETVLLAVPTGPASAEVIEEIEGPRIVSARGWLGIALSTPASGFVRHVLAELPDDELARTLPTLPRAAVTPYTKTSVRALREAIASIRRDGYGVVIDEYEVGLAGLGISVRQGGLLVAMLATAMPTGRLDDAVRVRSLSLLQEAAGQLGSSDRPSALQDSSR